MKKIGLPWGLGRSWISTLRFCDTSGNHSTFRMDFKAKKFELWNFTVLTNWNIWKGSSEQFSTPFSSPNLTKHISLYIFCTDFNLENSGNKKMENGWFISCTIFQFPLLSFQTINILLHTLTGKLLGNFLLQFLVEFFI